MAFFDCVLSIGGLFTFMHHKKFSQCIIRMPYINVEQLRNQRKQQEEREKMSKKMEESKSKRIMKFRAKEPLGRRPKPQKFEMPTPFIPPENPVNYVQEYQEVKSKIDEKIIEVLALPAKSKKEVLEQKIKDSNFMRSYIKRKTNSNLFEDYMNEDILFAALYFIYYEEAINKNIYGNSINVNHTLPATTINPT